MRLALILAALALAGCESVNPKASDLALPNARLMAAPKPLPDVKEGDDLLGANAQCSAAYVRETGRLRSLQTYAKTVTRKD